MKPHIVIFDGPDKTGKSTLKDAFNKATDFSHFVIDRGPLSNLVYNVIFNRNTTIDYTNMINHLASFNNLVVLCTADEKIVQKRLNDNNEVLPNGSDFNITMNMFKYFLYQSPFNYVIIDTTKDSIEECVNKILRVLVEGEK